MAAPITDAGGRVLTGVTAPGQSAQAQLEGIGVSTDAIGGRIAGARVGLSDPNSSTFLDVGQPHLSDATLAALHSIIAHAIDVRWDGTNFERMRTPNTYKDLAAVALTAFASNTPVSVWLPTTGKKFRMLGYAISLTTAASLIFHDLATVGNGGVIHRTPVLAAAGVYICPPMGNGFLSALANNQLWIDASTGTPAVSGFIFGTEE